MSLCLLAALRLAAGDPVGLKWCWRVCVLKMRKEGTTRDCRGRNMAYKGKEGLLGVLLVACHTDSSTPSAVCSQSALCQWAAVWWTARTRKRRRRRQGETVSQGKASNVAGEIEENEGGRVKLKCDVYACVGIAYRDPLCKLWLARCSYNLSR